MASINNKQEEMIMKFVVEKHENPEYVTIHTTEWLQSDNLLSDIMDIKGIVNASYSDAYKLKLKVGLAFDIDELIEKVQDVIVTYYANQEEN